MEPREVEVSALPLSKFSRLVGPERSLHLSESAEQTVRALGGRKVWNVNSTAVGGGVAEMLQVLVGYGLDAGIDTHWITIEGDAEFFSITKRIHNYLHGSSGDGGPLGPGEAGHYRSVSGENARWLAQRIRPGDIAILHDPQTVGMAGELARQGARVVWRCHIGTERPNDLSRQAWTFLDSHLRSCDHFVFSMSGFVPPQLTGRDVWIIAPSIDPFSPKNRPIKRQRSLAILGSLGLLAGEKATIADAVLGAARPLSPHDRLVVQVSRWDRLKDPLGVLEGFTEYLGGLSDVRLVLVGPRVEQVADDPEGAEVLATCLHAWETLPERARNKIRLVTLPMSDRIANARMVNAVQRHASVVVQKSVQEGFGLTVAESMWKSKPVVASAVGGIVSQVPPGTGLLLDDPNDLDTFGRALLSLFDRPAEMDRMGRRARQNVRDHFLSDRHLIDYGRLLKHVSEY